MRIQENNAVGFREIGEVRGITWDKPFRPLASRRAVLGNVLVERHHWTRHAVTDQNNFRDAGNRGARRVCLSWRGYGLEAVYSSGDYGRVIFITLICVRIKTEGIVSAKSSITAVSEFCAYGAVDEARARMHYKNTDLVSRAAAER